MERGVLFLDDSPGILTIEDKRRQWTLWGLSRSLSFLFLLVWLVRFVLLMVRSSAIIYLILTLFGWLDVLDFLSDILYTFLRIFICLLSVFNLQILAFLATILLFNLSLIVFLAYWLFDFDIIVLVRGFWVRYRLFEILFSLLLVRLLLIHQVLRVTFPQLVLFFICPVYKLTLLIDLVVTFRHLRMVSWSLLDLWLFVQLACSFFKLWLEGFIVTFLTN